LSGQGKPLVGSGQAPRSLGASRRCKRRCRAKARRYTPSFPGSAESLAARPYKKNKSRSLTPPKPRGFGMTRVREGCTRLGSSNSGRAEDYWRGQAVVRSGQAPSRLGASPSFPRGKPLVPSGQAGGAKGDTGLKPGATCGWEARAQHSFVRACLCRQTQDKAASLQDALKRASTHVRTRI